MPDLMKMNKYVFFRFHVFTTESPKVTKQELIVQISILVPANLLDSTKSCFISFSVVEQCITVKQSIVC